MAIPPSGYHTVTPRIVTSDVPALVGFLRDVFGAEGTLVANRPVEMRIGDSLVLVAAAIEREVFPAFLYVYVDDADDTYRRALAAGAASLEQPLDTPYGDRRAVIREHCGSIFQIAHRPTVRT